MNPLLIGIQARTNSTRLKGKIYEKIGDKSILEWVYNACCIEVHHKIIQCLPIVLGPIDDVRLRDFCLEKKMEYREGDPEDLVTRYLSAITAYQAWACIRVTGDCWRMEKAIVEECARLLTDTDYASNTVTRSFMEGLDVQGATVAGWNWLDRNQTERREHPWVVFDENAKVRDRFVLDGLTWRQMINKANPIFTKTSIDVQEELDLARQTKLA